MKLPNEYNPLVNLFENKKKNASYFYIKEFGKDSFDLHYMFGENFEGHYWIMIVRGRMVDFETKECKDIYVNSPPMGLMGTVLLDALNDLEPEKSSTLRDILFFS